MRRKRTVRRHIYGWELPHLSDLSIGGLLSINISWRCRRSSFRLPPSCLCSLASAPSSSHAHVPSSGSETAFCSPKMPVRLIAADDWRPSSMTERRLLELEREGLLRRRTSLSSPEWIAPPGAQAAQGLRGFIRQVPPPRPGCSSEPLHAGALPPLRGGAPALLPKCHHRCGGLCRGV